MEEKNEFKVQLDILVAISTMQNQNGIRMNDFMRYSKFCRKKINKLRKLFKLTQGKRKFSKIDINSENLTDSKILLIPLLNCERKWSHGMYLKQQLTTIGEDVKSLRYNIKRKFKRAALISNSVFELCKLAGDTQTILEAEAFYYFHQANYLMFKRNFEESLEFLKKATKIYENISKIRDTIESFSYKEKINSLKTMIRLCIYNLNTSNKDIILNEEEIQKTVDVDDDVLMGKLEEIKSIKINSSHTDQYEIKYQGSIIPIKNDKLRLCFQKIDDITKKIDNEPELNKKINTYTDIFNLIDEIVKILKKEKTDDQNFTKLYAKLLNYTQYLRFNKYVDKNLAYIEEYSKDFTDSFISDIFEKDNIKLRTRPQEIIKLYNNLTEYQHQLINLEKENQDQLYLTELNFKANAFSTFKIFYVSLIHLMNKKYEDVYTILHYLIEKIKELNEFYDVHNLNNFDYLNKIKIDINNLELKAEFLISKSYVKINREVLNINKMVIDSENKKKRMNTYLLDMIEKENEIDNSTFKLFENKIKISYDDYLEAIDKMNYNNYTNIAHLPPNVSLINPKPISYDLTFQRFQYPNLEEKMKKQEKGIFGRAFGYLFSGK